MAMPRVTLPPNLGSKTYLRVKCSNNIFFAMSATTPAKARTSNDTTDSDTVSINTSTLAAAAVVAAVPYPTNGCCWVAFTPCCAYAKDQHDETDLS